MAIQSLNPYTNEIEKTFVELSSQQIQEKIVLADQVYHSWKRTSFAEREQLMREVAKILRDNSDYYAAIATREMGKLLRETKDWELDNCAQIAEYYAKNAKKFMADKTLKWSLLTGSTVLQHHPLGVLFGIMPWNYPFYQVMRFAIPNIMAGNTVMVKHASNVPQCAEAIEDIFLKAGFPQGVYTNLLVSGRNCGQIIEDKRIQGISLTGSEAAGAKVAEQAGKALKKVVLELGGSDPFIILDDADLDYAGDVALIARFFNSGQTCIAAKRFILHQSIYDQFIEKFKARIKTLKPGDPMEYKTRFAPMSSHDERDNLLGIIKHAVEQGATLLHGGSTENLPGAWLQPTLIGDITPDMDIYRQELFGPVAMMFKAKDDAHAIELANDSDYGLSSVVFAKNKQRAQQVADQLETGMTFINMPSISEPDAPFGGVKRSGFGRELSNLAMEEFVNRKMVRQVPIWAFKMNLAQQAAKLK